MKTTFNSASVRNEVIEMQSQNLTITVKKPIDKGIIAVIAFFTVLVSARIGTQYQ